MKNFSQIEIKLFKFDCKVDYLPYYKTYIVSYIESDSMYDILNKINAIEKFSYDEKEVCNIRVNGFFLSADVLIKDIVDKTGMELVIEPISFYRVTNDLLIDCQDYDTKLELFSKYLSISEKIEFNEKYKLEYYSANTILINKDYIGDHSLLIANEIISKNKHLEKEILQVISNKDTGILYHTSLTNRIWVEKNDLENIYINLINKIDMYKSLEIVKKEKSTLPVDLNIKQYFNGFNIALYNSEGCIYRKLIKQSRAKYINLDSRRNDLSLNSRIINKNFSLKIAGEILLEAKDKNADFLIVKNEEDLKIFDGMQSKIENIMTREIELPIITEGQFIMLLEGEKDLTKLNINKHKIEVSFLSKHDNHS